MSHESAYTLVDSVRILEPHMLSLYHSTLSGLLASLPFLTAVVIHMDEDVKRKSESTYTTRTRRSLVMLQRENVGRDQTPRFRPLCCAARTTLGLISSFLQTMVS